MTLASYHKYLLMKNKPTTIACFLWGQWCEPHGIEYVNKLYNMIKRHLTIDHDFVCFTDRAPGSFDPGITQIQIPEDVLQWPRTLPKFCIYAPDNGITGRVVLCDLDSVIVDNVDEMFSYQGRFCGVKPFNPKNHGKAISGGLLSFNKEEYQFIWDEISLNKEKYFDLKYADPNGEYGERYILKEILGVNNVNYWQDLFPTQFIGYRTHCYQKGGYPKDARFIAFWYKLAPHSSKDRWVKENWK